MTAQIASDSNEPMAIWRRRVCLYKFRELTVVIIYSRTRLVKSRIHIHMFALCARDSDDHKRS